MTTTDLGIRAGVTYEYAMLGAKGGKAPDLIARLNDLATEGWELVALAVQDAGWGTALGAPLRREIVPLPQPLDLAADWYRDPSGRFELRYWNGRAWTFNVSTNGTTGRDAPTQLP